MATVRSRTVSVAPQPEEEQGCAPPVARFRVSRRLLRNPVAVAGLTLLAAVVLLALLAPMIARYSPTATDFSALNQAPSPGHWLGTDYLGRDTLSRVLYGARISLPVGLAVVAIELGIGVSVGLVAGYFGRMVDAVLMRLVDVQLALPGLLLPLGVIAIIGPSLKSTIVALGIGGIPAYARMARAATLRVRAQEYILASRSTGNGTIAIILRHILPNVLDTLAVQATLGFGIAILGASALSYLGVGVQPPSADWGSLLSSGYEHMFESWSEIVFPGIAVTLTVLGANLLGDGLADALNPRLG